MNRRALFSNDKKKSQSSSNVNQSVTVIIKDLSNPPHRAESSPKWTESPSDFFVLPNLLGSESPSTNLT